MRILSRRLFMQVAAAVAAATVATPVLSATPPPNYAFELEVTEHGYRLKIPRSVVENSSIRDPHARTIEKFFLGEAGCHRAPGFSPMDPEPLGDGWCYSDNYHPTLRMHAAIRWSPCLDRYGRAGKGIYQIWCSGAAPDSSQAMWSVWHLVAATDTHFVYECYDPYDARRVIASAELPNGQTLEFKL